MMTTQSKNNKENLNLAYFSLPFEQWINIGEKLGNNGQYLMPQFIEEESYQTRKGLDNPVVFMMLNNYDATCVV